MKPPALTLLAALIAYAGSPLSASIVYTNGFQLNGSYSYFDEWDFYAYTQPNFGGLLAPMTVIIDSNNVMKPWNYDITVRQPGTA